MLQREDIFAYMDYVSDLNVSGIGSENFKQLINWFDDLTMTSEIRNDPELNSALKNLLNSLAIKIKEEAERRIEEIAKVAIAL